LNELENSETEGTKRNAIAKLSYTHEALIDLIIAHPEYKQYQLAAAFGYTAAWVCQILASDSFQSAFAKRKDELVDPVLAASIEEQFGAMVRRSHEILMEKLNRPANAIPDNLALRTYELGMKGAGYGAKTPEPRVQVNVVSHLETLGTNLESLLRRKRAEFSDLCVAQAPDGGQYVPDSKTPFSLEVGITQSGAGERHGGDAAPSNGQAELLPGSGASGDRSEGSD
jgi:hypothetical protein